ncbi:hypothetical protein [Rhodococcus qingshengii]|uniref:hypothetical protein n=1 Tax=Rhodococcus qingshengii TaxID=334542 RepID=UPI0035D865CE
MSGIASDLFLNHMFFLGIAVPALLKWDKFYYLIHRDDNLHLIPAFFIFDMTINVINTALFGTLVFTWSGTEHWQLFRNNLGFMIAALGMLTYGLMAFRVIRRSGKAT